MADMRGRTALVTGGAHGIGAAVVRRLLAAGARVTVLDPELPGELEPAEGLALVEGDVRRREDVRKAAAGVDAVVAVAGIGALTPLLEIDDATWQRMLDVNLTGVFLTVLVARCLRPRRVLPRRRLLGVLRAVLRARGVGYDDLQEHQRRAIEAATR